MIWTFDRKMMANKGTFALIQILVMGPLKNFRFDLLHYRVTVTGAWAHRLISNSDSEKPIFGSCSPNFPSQKVKSALHSKSEYQHFHLCPITSISSVYWMTKGLPESVIFSFRGPMPMKGIGFQRKTQGVDLEEQSSADWLNFVIPIFIKRSSSWDCPASQSLLWPKSKIQLEPWAKQMNGSLLDPRLIETTLTRLLSRRKISRHVHNSRSERHSFIFKRMSNC